jgi:hypothetical protein
MSMCGDPDYNRASYLSKSSRLNDDLLRKSYTVIDLS